MRGSEGGFTIRRRALRCDMLCNGPTHCTIVNIVRRSNRVAPHCDIEKCVNRSGFYSSVMTRATPEQLTNVITACDLYVSSIKHRIITVWGYGRGEVKVVRDLPCLWQVNSKSYRDQRARKNTWRQVTEKVCDY